jgi:hypothetical protein
MKFKEHTPPREFESGPRYARVMSRDCGIMELEENEMITFKTLKGGEYDVARKCWGFYATPSLNGRLPRFGLRAVLVKNFQARFFILLVEDDQREAFESYVKEQDYKVIVWLDDASSLARIETLFEHP